MKINNNSINSAAHLYEQQQRAVEAKKKAVHSDSKNSQVTKAAEVLISDEAKELAKSNQIKTQHQEKLASLKAQIKAGTYQPKIEDIAESIVKHFFGAR